MFQSGTLDHLLFVILGFPILISLTYNIHGRDDRTRRRKTLESCGLLGEGRAEQEVRINTNDSITVYLHFC